MTRGSARPWLVAAVVGMGSTGCGQELLIGIAGDGSGSGSDGPLSSSGSSAVADSSTGGVSGTASSTAGPGTTGGSSDSSASDAGSSSSSGSAPVRCEAPPGHTVCDAQIDPVADPELMFHAIGLACNGGPFEIYPISNGSALPADPDSFRVTREYGNELFWPTEGSNLLMLTTGLFDAVDGSGALTVAPGMTDEPGQANDNPVGPLPGPIVPELGSADGAGGSPFMDCDGVGDCSDSLPPLLDAGGPARDAVTLSFDIEVPAGTLGYRVDLAWFSSEYPARADVVGTDVALWWQSSEAFTGNVATLDGAALSASSLAGWLPANGLYGDVPELSGTGYEGTTGSSCMHPGGMFASCPRGASTGWMTMTGPAMPGETITMMVALFDLVDTDRDSALLVDNWRWNCEGCEPGGDCGLGPLVERAR